MCTKNIKLRAAVVEIRCGHLVEIIIPWYWMSCLLGAVSLAGADSGLWAVDGGNKRVCSGLLYHSKSELIPAKVTSISVKVRPSKTGTFHIHLVQNRSFSLTSLLMCVFTFFHCQTFYPNFPPSPVFRHHGQFLRGELCWRIRLSTLSVRHSGNSNTASPGKV